MKKSLKHIITVLLAVCIMITGNGFCGIISVSAAAKPVISSRQALVIKNACTVKKGSRVKLQAESGGKDVTKKCTWKSSRKSVASVSRKGVLTAKKAGTAYITAKYKGKTSKKLKVVVETVTDPETGNPADPGNIYNPGGTSGDYTITYDKNSSDKGSKLNGPAAQSGSGEILKFSTTVTPASGKKFLGWYDAPTGGNRIYETYKPSGDMTLYAHYTDENVQKVEFVLGCNYGDTYSFMSKNGEDLLGYHWRDYNWLEQKTGGPMHRNDDGNVIWSHNYEVGDDKSSFAVDDMPVPEIPGYSFVGWYTKDQGKEENAFSGDKVDSNGNVSTDVVRLYARFSKKLTISFDDLRGGTYDNIVVDSYKSIKDCGQKLPKPDLPGATFLGWTMDADNHIYNWSKPIITEDSVFLNCIEWYGFMCSGCGGISKHRINRSYHCEYGCTVSAVNDNWHVFEETDHFTLYPVYKYQNVSFSFDPNGGYFPVGTYANNAALTFDGEYYDVNNSYESVGKMVNKRGGYPYGALYLPGHGEDAEGDLAGWPYGNGSKTFPVVRKRGYVFDKWVYKDAEGNEQPLTFETMITGNMTFYAKWNPGECGVYYDPSGGQITQEERDRVGLRPGNYYYITTESTIANDGKQMPVPVSSDGREFIGWYTGQGERVNAGTQILKDTTIYAHWGTKTDNKPETQKPSTDNDNSSNKDTDSNNKNETVHAADMAMTDMEWKPVDKNSNHYTVEYGGKGNPTGLGFTANVLPAALKDSARNVIWTSSNPDIISVTAGKEVIYSPNWFDYFEFGSDTGDVVLTATSEDNPDVKFDIHVTVAKK